MDLRSLRPGAELFEQLGLGIVEEGEEREGWVTPEEAHRRSEAAKLALRTRINGGERTEEGEPTDWGGSRWFEQYQALLDAGWPWRVACYIAWAASPRIGRWPSTQDGLAREVLGLTGPRQIATWRKRNASIDETIAIIQAAPLMEHRADVLRALAVSASDPDHRSNPDRKLYLELIGDYTPRQRVEVRREDVDDLSGMSEADLERLARLGAASVQRGAGDDGDNEGDE